MDNLIFPTKQLGSVKARKIKLFQKMINHKEIVKFNINLIHL